MIQRSIALCSAVLLLFAACKKDKNDNGVVIAKEVYALPVDTLFPEGIAYRESGHFYTGSTTSGDIIKVNVETGDAAIWSSGITQGRKSAVGLKLDGNDRLWICGGEEGKVSVLDGNGALIKMWDLKTMFGAEFINDCISDGNYMYFTDSRVRKIYRASLAGVPTVMEEWLSFANDQIPYTPNVVNANGIVVTPDNKYLIVVISSSGKLYRITIADKSIKEISLNTTVTAGDGLVLDGNMLYVSRNALNQIFPVTLSSQYDSGTVGAGFGQNLDFNTTMARVGKYLLTVNGQLNKRTTRTQSLPFTVVRVAIP